MGAASIADMRRVDAHILFPEENSNFLIILFFVLFHDEDAGDAAARIPHRKFRNFYFISKWLRRICKCNASQRMSDVCEWLDMANGRWIRRRHVHRTRLCATCDLSACIKIMFNCDEHKSLVGAQHPFRFIGVAGRILKTEFVSFVDVGILKLVCGQRAHTRAQAK